MGDSVNDPRDRTEHGAMRGCGSCEAPWIREEVAVGYERRGVDDHLDEPFASSRREVTCVYATSVGATGRAMGGVGGGAVDASDGTGYGATWGCTTCEATWKCEGASVECERRGVDDELDEPLVRSGRDAKWECEMCVDAFGGSVDDEADVPFACPGRDTTWG
jgi:hypothetical protein